MNEAFRLSRIRAPRGTLAAIILLAAVFLVFGLIASSLMPEQAAAEPRYFEPSVLAFTNWLVGS